MSTKLREVQNMAWVIPLKLCFVVAVVSFISAPSTQ